MDKDRSLHDAEATLRESEQKYRSLFENMSEGFAYCRMLFEKGRPEDFIYLAVNPAFEKLTGLRDAVGRKVSELLPGIRESDPVIFETYGRVALSGQPERFETYVVALKHWFSISVYCPAREHFVAVFDVITERKRVEEALRQREEHFRALIENALDIISVIDPDGNIRYESPAVGRILGYRPGELVGRDCFSLVHPDDAPRIRAIFAAGIGQAALIAREELRFRHKDGSWRVLEAIGKNLIADPSVQGVVVNSRDITERKLAETALRDAESLYHSLVEHLPQGVFRKDLDGRFTYVNRHFCALMRKTPEELLSKTVFDLFPRHIAEKYRQDDQRVLQTQEVFETIDDQLSLGQPKSVVHVVIAPVRNASGEVLGVQGIFTDITSQRELEAKFLRVQRLESIGSLASGIAHDLNNILAPIIMSLPLLREEGSNAEREQLLTLIDSSSQRAVSIVKQLLSFGRGQAGEKTVLQVRHLLREVGKIARETFPRSIQIREDSAADLWLVTGDPTQLHQVLLNLCVNARDAMPSGGTLTLGAENVMLDEHYASARKDVVAGPFVRLQVQDTGTGIPEAAREHIFDSFFTTKGADHGTGLGLTTVLGIVKNHRGFITFTTAEGKGTTFEIHLPATLEAQPATRNDRFQGKIPRAHGELILLVDDEPSVRDAGRRTLERHGYAVVQAQDGIDALAQFTSRRAEIRAVITDFMMPQMDGVTFARTLRRLSPQTPIIVSSGGLQAKPAGDPLEAFSALGIRHILHKPHNAEVLLQALDEALHPNAPSSKEGAEWP